MATSQQGKKKKKVLSQQQIDKLLGMLREEDKPLRAGILAKTLGYQSAKDINPTLLRLEGYGMVSRVVMNNTPLWKYVSHEGIAVMTSTSPRDMDDIIKGKADMDAVHLLVSPRLQHENGTITQVIEGREDSCPSRPQSTKADLEWDPSDIQVHQEEEVDMLHTDINTLGNGNADFTSMAGYNGNSTLSSNFANAQHNLQVNSKGIMGIPLDRISSSSASRNGTNINKNGMGDVPTLSFTNDQGYAIQDHLYNTLEAHADQNNISDIHMNGLDNKTTNNQNFTGQDYHTMSAYNGNGDTNMNEMGPNLNSSLQTNYNVSYNHQSSHSEGSRGGAIDMYMLSNSSMRQVNNGIGTNHTSHSNIQNFPPAGNHQVRSDYSNTYSSSITSTTLAPKSSTSANQYMQQNIGRENHNHNHYGQNSYNSSSGSVSRMPTYIVQEIIKPETSGQFGLTRPQGPTDTQNLGNYQSLQPHPHAPRIDAGVMSYSAQPYHATPGLNNGGPTSQTHHHHQTQQQQHLPVQQQQQQPHHQHHTQQQLAQAANFVNISAFTGGTYNQFQGTYGLGSSNRNFNGQHQNTNYGTGGITSKDLANFSGNGPAYHGNQLKQHFNGYTNAGIFHNQIRPQIYGKVGSHIQPQFTRQGYGRNYSDKPKGNNYRSKHNGIQGRGRKLVKTDNYHENIAKQSGSGNNDKDAVKADVNKYIGTEVLDDICRRLASHVSVQKKKAEGSPEKQDTAKCKTDGNGADKIQTEKKDEVKHTDKSNIDHEASAKTSDREVKNIGSNNSVKLANGKERTTDTRSQNGHHSYDGSGKYQPYVYRGNYRGRDMSRYYHHQRNSTRNCAGPARASESGGNGKPSSQHQINKVLSTPAGKEKTENTILEKDDSKGSEKAKLVEVKCSDLGNSLEQIQDDRPMAKYKPLLTDHLDPNNVLLSHLFVRGLIDRVLVDQVRRMKTRRDAMEVLLPALLGISQEAICGGFCDALHKSGQVYLAELIKATGLTGGLMSEKHAAYLKLHHQNIAASMIPDKELLAYLRTDSVLTHDLHQFVSTQPSRAQQIDALLQVLPFRGDKAFETFRTALRRSGQPWLAEQIAMELT